MVARTLDRDPQSGRRAAGCRVRPPLPRASSERFALEPNAVAALPLFGHRSLLLQELEGTGTSGPANDLDIGGKAMETIGHVESLWRYPVKSMRGQEIREAFLGFAGVYGDRQYAFRDVAAPKGFPFLTGREQEAMLLYQPRFRHPDRAAEPPNLEDADGMAPGMTPVYASATDLMVDVEAPSGKVLAVDDPALIEMLSDGTGPKACPVPSAIGPSGHGLPTSLGVLNTDRETAWR